MTEQRQAEKRRYRMRFGKLLRGGEILAGALVLSLFTGSLCVHATQETQEALDKARKKAQETQQAVNEEQEKADALGETQDALSDQLEDYNSKLSVLSSSLARLNTQISEQNEKIAAKQDEIDAAEEKLKAAVQQQEEQYESMKRRIQFLYEKGNTYYLEILLTASSYGDLLNRRNYIQKLNEYDRKTLESYKRTAEEIAQNKAALEEEQQELQEQQEELQDLHADVDAQADQVTTLVSQTAGALSSTNAQIDSVQDAVELLQDQLEEQKATVSALEKQLAEEKRLQALSDASAWRSLGSITFEDGDRALLANLIYCEAGGEPYAGQLAVGAVVINRLMSGAFPNTLSGVIYQSSQFSPAGSGRLAVALAGDEATASCYQAADAAMSGQTNVGSCLFFRTPIPQVEPKYTIGGHIFY